MRGGKLLHFEQARRIFAVGLIGDFRENLMRGFMISEKRIDVCKNEFDFWGWREFRKLGCEFVQGLGSLLRAFFGAKLARDFDIFFQVFIEIHDVDNKCLLGS
ncbi:hypothetical protein M2103_000324 [Ereboglobus sp. PH5-5]|uniref:hypothetical protein n=1 Tax=unclassified Ereboglobus TaxID=2626932 RepID=UPI002407443A|nr:MULTISPECIES: hypothetical protein [unclassified Ereboglobus]MDF9826103.1 hypothetical protein [Ereboglobus sp. PH5-10]MDF9832116.1 hypothetical protein [Ereboglobus sp. PH5-5]